jgi:hypothetical protein
MPARQTTQTNNRGRGGRGVHYSCGGRLPPFNPTAQSPQMMPYMGAQPVNSAQHWRLRASEYEHGHAVGEVSSSYTLTETDTTSQTDTEPPRQDSPVPQSLKGRPLD